MTLFANLRSTLVLPKDKTNATNSLTTDHWLLATFPI